MNKSNWIGGCAVLLVGWLLFWTVVGIVMYRYETVENAKAIVAEQAAATYDIKFGVLATGPDGADYLSEETATIPLKLHDTGFKYGLVITPPNDQEYTVHFIIHFSAPPKVLTGNLSSTDGDASTVRTDPERVTGVNVQTFWFDPGDPLGDQSIDVYINDKLVKTIHYTVIPAS